MGIKIMKKNSGFTMVEVLIVAGILGFSITGMILLFNYTNVTTELAAKKSWAVNNAQNKIEEMRNYTYDQIATDYGTDPGNKFSISSINGMGRIYIDSSNAELLTVDVVVCWLDKYSRVVGEDTNRNGQLDAGEDTDGDGLIDSTVHLTTMITRR